MLDLNVTVQGDKVIIEGLQALAADMPHVLQRGLKRINRGVHRSAMDFLNGPGRTVMKQKNRLRGQSDDLGARPGSYPVPVITGNLKRLLDFIDPSQSKDRFSAGPLEAIVYDSAEYANVIHEGTGSSTAYGRRPFLDDALEHFNQGGQIAGILEEEVQKEVKKRGLAK